LKLRALLLIFALGGVLAVVTSGSITPYADAVDFASIARGAAARAGVPVTVAPRKDSSWRLSLPGYHRVTVAGTVHITCTPERFGELVSNTHWILEELATNSGARILAAQGGTKRWRMVYAQNGILGTVEVHGGRNTEVHGEDEFILELHLQESR